jgi:hypothetical protein
MSSGEVVLDKEGGGYGIAVRRTSGTSSITPSNFDGVLHVQERGLYVVGTPEVLTVSGKNLYNKADGVLKGYPSATGTWNGRYGDTSELSIIVTLEEGKTYTAQRASGGNCSFRVMGSANRPLEQGQSLMVISSPSSITDDVMTFTVPSGYPHIVFYVRNNAGTSLTTEDVVNAFQVELGSEATDYQPFVQPQTASVPMLLSVGDVKDEAELIAGTYTHRCAACEYDGTQDVGDTYLSTTGGKDIGAIIVYPLPEPTTESVTPQPLTLAEGTNIIDATANVEPLTAKCEYQAVSALDILSTLLGTKSGTEDMSIKDAKDVVNVILGDDNK